jgi:hypothetical protein
MYKWFIIIEWSNLCQLEMRNFLAEQYVVYRDKDKLRLPKEVETYIGPPQKTGKNSSMHADREPR